MLPSETIPNENMKNPCRSHTTGLNGHWLDISTCKDIGIQTTAIKMSLTAKFVINMFGTVRRRAVLSTVKQIKTLLAKARTIRVVRTADSNTFIDMLRRAKSVTSWGYSSKETIAAKLTVVPGGYLRSINRNC